MKHLFYSIIFTLSFIFNTFAQGTVNYEFSLTYGNSLSLEAVPNDGYEFINWTVKSTGDQYSLNNPLVIAGISSDLDLVANFKKLLIMIQLINTDGGGNPTGAGTYEWGQEITLDANPWISHDFVGWQHNGVIISTDNPYTFLATENLDITPLYELKTFIITIDVNPSDGGTIQVNPNPTTGQLHIDYPDLQHIDILSITGQHIERTSGTDNIDISHLPSGQYIIRATNKFNNQSKIVVLI